MANKNIYITQIAIYGNTYRNYTEKIEYDMHLQLKSEVVFVANECEMTFQTFECVYFGWRVSESER